MTPSSRRNQVDDEHGTEDAGSECSSSSNLAPTTQGMITRFASLPAFEEPQQQLTPLQGYEKEPLVSLEEAVQPLIHLLGDDIDHYVWIAKQNSKTPHDGLTTDESASIHLYSMQWSVNEESLYLHLNRVLRSVDRNGLRPWFRYLKLFLTALYKLPSKRRTVWRGVRANLSTQYAQGEVFTWWGVSSCTASMSVMEAFVGHDVDRTLFAIEAINAKNIRQHSFYKAEDEIVLLPGTYLRVLSKFSPAPGLTLIQMQESEPPYRFIAPPFPINKTPSRKSKSVSALCETSVPLSLPISSDRSHQTSAMHPSSESADQEKQLTRTNGRPIRKTSKKTCSW